MAQSGDRDTFDFDGTDLGDGNVTGNVAIIDPATIGTGSGTVGSGTADPPRRRGRKPGSKNKAASVHLDVKGIEGLLLSIHAMLAAITKEPAMVLQPAEATALAQAVANVQRHYPQFETTQVVVDWAALCMALIMVYGTRMAAMQMKKKKAKAEASNVAPGPWTPYAVPTA